MAVFQQTLEKLQLLSFHPVAARTSTGNGTGVDLIDYDGDVVFILDSAAGTGTTPTLDVTVESSADNSTFTAVSGAAFTRVTTTAGRQKLVISHDDAARYVRIVYTIGGTTPSFTFSVTAVGLKKYG